MDGFSPLTRKIVAAGLLVLALMLAANLLIVPYVTSLSNGLAGLADARFRVQRLEAIRTRPVPAPGSAVPPSAYLASPNRQAASERMATLIGDAATRRGLQLGQLAPLPADPASARLVKYQVAVSGEQMDVLGWINELELAAPPLRFETWVLQADSGAAPVSGAGAKPVTLTFNGTAAAAWGAPQ